MKILSSATVGSVDALVKGIPHDDLADANNVLVLARRHERHDLAQTRDRKPMLLLVELELLQSVDLARVVTSGAEDDAIGTFLDVVEARVAVD